MRKNLFLLLFLGILVPILTVAHPPKKVILKMKSNSKTLTVKVVHPVKDIKTHFIKSLVVKVNGVEVKTVDLTPESPYQSKDIDIELPNLKPGDEIAVVATCNRIGSKTGKIKI
jgi:hypothetical protein